MKTFNIILSDNEGVVIEQYIVGAYHKAEAESLFDGDHPEHDAIYEWVEVDGPGSLDDLSKSITENIRQQAQPLPE